MNLTENQSKELNTFLKTLWQTPLDEMEAMREAVIQELTETNRLNSMNIFMLYEVSPKAFIKMICKRKGLIPDMENLIMLETGKFLADRAWEDKIGAVERIYSKQK